MNATRWTVLAVLLAVAGVAAQGVKYKATAKADKHTDFSLVKTYAWEEGWAAFDLAVDSQIIAAVDRELAASGLTQVPLGASDVVVTYVALRRTDVDVKARERPDGSRPTYPVATLIVLMREPGTHRELFVARAVTPIDPAPGTLDALITDQVARMFAPYPTRRPRRR